MKIVLTLLGRIGLIMTIMPAFLFFFEIIDMADTKNWMLAGTALWFVCAPITQRLKTRTSVE